MVGNFGHTREYRLPTYLDSSAWVVESRNIALFRRWRKVLHKREKILILKLGGTFFFVWIIPSPPLELVSNKMDFGLSIFCDKSRFLILRLRLDVTNWTPSRPPLSLLSPCPFTSSSLHPSLPFTSPYSSPFLVLQAWHLVHISNCVGISVGLVCLANALEMEKDFFFGESILYLTLTRDSCFPSHCCLYVF